MQKPDSPKPVPAAKPGPAPRSEAMEAELAMLEAILPPAAERSAQPTRDGPPTDRGDT
jgi:hypothetical protein